MLEMLKKYISFDLFDRYENICFRDEKNFIQVMKDIFAKTNRPFVILIDEWDCLFSEYAHNTDAQRRYLPDSAPDAQGQARGGDRAEER